IDIVAVRGADALGGWLVTGLRMLGMEARAVALAAVAIAATGIALSAALGRAHGRRATMPKL
ncbi:MAG TPA: MFS transporter, partial [Burkholderiales bacterium]|nr:MFS transporter [Burkholderiales bacterium]